MWKFNTSSMVIFALAFVPVAAAPDMDQIDKKPDVTRPWTNGFDMDQLPESDAAPDMDQIDKKPDVTSPWTNGFDMDQLPESDIETICRVYDEFNAKVHSSSFVHEGLHSASVTFSISSNINTVPFAVANLPKDIAVLPHTDSSVEIEDGTVFHAMPESNTHLRLTKLLKCPKGITCYPVLNETSENGATSMAQHWDGKVNIAKVDEESGRHDEAMDCHILTAEIAICSKCQQAWAAPVFTGDYQAALLLCYTKEVNGFVAYRIASRQAKEDTSAEPSSLLEFPQEAFDPETFDHSKWMQRQFSVTQQWATEMHKRFSDSFFDLFVHDVYLEDQKRLAKA